MVYKNTEFKPGDLLLLEWNNEVDTSKVEWTFPADENWPEGTEYIDYSDLDSPTHSTGFYIDGHENIFPDKITVLKPGTTTINLANLKPADYTKVEEGQTLIIKSKECLAEITLNEYSFDESEYDPEEECYWVNGANMSFDLEPNEDSQLLGQR